MLKSKRPLVQIGFASLILHFATAAWAQQEGSITLFGQFGYSEAFSGSRITPADEQMFVCSDLLATYSFADTTLLGEFTVREGQITTERLKIGRSLGDDHQI